MVTFKLKRIHSCNTKCYIDAEGFVKVIDSHLHHKSGDVAEMVQDNDVVTSDHIVAQQANRYIVAFHIAIARYPAICSGLNILGGL